MKRLMISLCACICLLQSPLFADFYAPASLVPGDTFHWAFVTSTTHSALLSDISVYNAFVNQAADDVAATTDVLDVVGVSELGQIDWKAIVSTAEGEIGGVTARENTGSPPQALTSPIYLFDGTFIAADGDDLYSGISDDLDLTELLTRLTWDARAWTGSTWTGDRDTYPVGAYGMISTYGAPAWRAQWLSAYFEDSQLLYHVYAISSELTKQAEITPVPLPSSIVMGLLGLLSSSVVARKRRRKHQVTDSTL